MTPRQNSSLLAGSKQPRPIQNGKRQSQTKVQAEMTESSDIQGIVHNASVPSGQTVKYASYKLVLIRLRDKVRKNKQTKTLL